MRHAGQVGADRAAAAGYGDGMIDGARQPRVTPGGQVGSRADAAHAAAGADQQDSMWRAMAGADCLLVLEEMAQRQRATLQLHGQSPSAARRKPPPPGRVRRPAEKLA